MSADRVVTIKASEVAIDDEIYFDGRWQQVLEVDRGWAPPDFHSGGIAPDNHEDSTRYVVLRINGRGDRRCILLPDRDVSLKLPGSRR